MEKQSVIIEDNTLEDIDYVDVLHAHSEYSPDGLKFDYEEIKNSPIRALAKTEHGNVYGLYEHYVEMKKIGKIPILGCELYVENILQARGKDVEGRKDNHLIVLAKDARGVKNLYKIISLSKETYRGNNITSIATLFKYSQGLICLSGCISGEIPRYLENGEYQNAKMATRTLQAIFKEDFYIEIQRHGLEAEKNIEPGLIKLAREFDIKVVATPDSHYMRKRDKIAQKIKVCKKYNKKMESFKGMEGSNYHLLMSLKKWKEIYKDLPEVFATQREIVEKCKDLEINVNLSIEDYHFPKFLNDENMKSDVYFIKKVWEAYYDKVEKGIIEDNEENSARVENELDVILELGYADYFLIEASILEYCKEEAGIWVGPGRGSAAGCYISYLLGITDEKIDPIKYKLSFERFLNRFRKKMPDIDTDICFNRRQELIKYIEDKYNTDPQGPCVAFITTFNTWGAKDSINEVGSKYEKYTPAFYRGISKLIPTGYTIEEALQSVEELQERYNTEEDVKFIIDTAKLLEGNKSSISRHASGLIIADKALHNYTALTTHFDEGLGREIVCIQDDGDYAEKKGLLKFDFLGLLTGTIIQDTVKLIGGDFKIENIPLDDLDVYKTLAKGNSVGVFQCEGRGITKLLKEIFQVILKTKDNSITPFEALMHGISLIRPGAKEFSEEFIENLKNPKKVKYLHESLESILEDTLGILIYQEQVSQIFQTLAGYSPAKADIVRRAISGKDEEAILGEKDAFVSGCITNGISKDMAEELFDILVKFSKYAFNKSHSASYALLAYQTAYLKHKFPVEFMCAMLTNICRKGDARKKLPIYIQECKRLGIKVLPPDVNNSNFEFKVEGDKTIRFGFIGIKNLNKDLGKEIVSERNKKFLDENDFINRLRKIKSFDKGALKTLILSGTLDSLSNNTRKNNFENLDSLFNQKNYTDLDLFEELLGIELTDDTAEKQVEFSLSEIQAYEEDYLGALISSDIFRDYNFIIDKLRVHSLSDIMIDSLFTDGETVATVGFVLSAEIKQNKYNKYILYKVTDGTNTMQAFADIKYKQILQTGNIVYIKGIIQHHPKYGSQINKSVFGRLYNTKIDSLNKDECFISNSSLTLAIIEDVRTLPEHLIKPYKLCSYDGRTRLEFCCENHHQTFVFDKGRRISFKNTKTFNYLQENIKGLVVVL